MKNHACVNFFLAAFFLVFTAHFSAAPAYAQWKKAESEHFTVYSQDDEGGANLRQNWKNLIYYCGDYSILPIKM